METVAEVLNDTTTKIQKSFEALKAQFAGLRTGKASTAMVDGIQAEAWGSKQPLKNIATISTPEPRQIKITPFDPSRRRSRARSRSRRSIHRRSTAS